MQKSKNLIILIVGLTSVLALANFNKSHFRQERVEGHKPNLNFSVVL
jgi:hypothetical protein